MPDRDESTGPKLRADQFDPGRYEADLEADGKPRKGEIWPPGDQTTDHRRDQNIHNEAGQATDDDETPGQPLTTPAILPTSRTDIDAATAIPSIQLTAGEGPDQRARAWG